MNQTEQENAANVPLQATTTSQQDKTTSGQRRINLIWEVTQAVIVVMITAAQIYCSLTQIESKELSYAFFLVVSMYLVRTNHTKTGGVGEREFGR